MTQSSYKYLLLLLFIMRIPAIYTAEMREFAIDDPFGDIAYPLLQHASSGYQGRISIDLTNETTVEHALRAYDTELTLSEVGAYGKLARCIAYAARSPEAARAILALEAFGTNLYLLSLPSQTLTLMGIAPIVPYIGVVSAVCALICGMFNDDNTVDPWKEQMLNFMQDFYQIVMKRFDYLEECLEANHREVMHATFKQRMAIQEIARNMRHHFKKIETDQDVIKGGLISLDDAQKSNQQQTAQLFAAVPCAQIETTLADVLHMLDVKQLTSDDLVQAVHKIHTAIMVHAKDPAVTGAATSNPQEALTYQTPLNNILEHPVFSQINCVTAYVERKLPTSTIIGRLANPLLWARCVQVLLHCLEKTDAIPFSTEAERNAVESDLLSIMRTGEQYIAMIDRTMHENHLVLLITACQEALQRVHERAVEHMTQEVDHALLEKMATTIDTETQVALEQVGQVPVPILDGTADNMVAMDRFINEQFCSYRGSPPTIFRCIPARYYLPDGTWHKLVDSDTALSRELADYFRTRKEGYAKPFDQIKRDYRQELQKQADAIREHAQRCYTLLVNPDTAATVLQEPLHILVYPADERNKQLLYCDRIILDQAYMQAYYCGHIAFKATYTIEGKIFYLRLYMGDNLLKEYQIPYDEYLTTDEYIAAYWHGLRRCMKSSQILFEPAPGAPRVLKEYPVLPVPPAAKLAIEHTAACISHEQSYVDTVREINAAHVHKKRLEANQTFLGAVKAPAESPIKHAVQDLNERYLALEALTVLAFNTTFPQHPACAALRAPHLIKNLQTLIAFTQHEYSDSTNKLYEGNEYIPVEPTIQALEEMKESVQQSPKPTFAGVQNLLRRLRFMTYFNIGTRPIKPQSLPEETSFLREQITALVAQQRNLTAGFDELRRTQQDFAQVTQWQLGQIHDALKILLASKTPST